VTASVGLRCASSGELTSEEMLRDADAAMYRAKELGKDRSERFNTALRAEVQQRMELESDLRRAVARDQLRLVYQPQIDLRTGAITGTEALLRWDHPRLGVIPPMTFIPIAERNGLIGPIGAWVLHEACVQACSWPGTEMAVNVSPRSSPTPPFPDLVAASCARPAWSRSGCAWRSRSRRSSPIRRTRAARCWP
jgi:predicted signal transduction protein with EAL and GGDEF domain